MIRPFRRFHEEPKTYTRKFKLRAASMVLDNNCSVPDVCASMDVGPTTLRRWIDQVRKERQGQAAAGTKAITPEQKELQVLRAKIKHLETEAEILKNCLPGAPRPIGLETLRTTLIPLDSGRWLFWRLSPRQKTCSRGSCGPVSGGALRDPV
ncbi:transposase [Pseudomonas sp. NFIX28]|uniref:transposase n=1 Tax=Pseudomonas sp. NFIX28 TaxID=1566235 RepID=UPI000B844966|nr:transposase [Pseudomonas sp. NFIX28]